MNELIDGGLNFDSDFWWFLRDCFMRVVIEVFWLFWKFFGFFSKLDIADVLFLALWSEPSW